MGAVTFEKVVSTSAGLDFASTTREPVRGALVKLVDAATSQQVLMTGATAEDGTLDLSWTGGPNQVRVIVFTSSVSPKVVVEDNSAKDAPWAFGSGTLGLTTTTTVNLNAGSGWTGSGYGKPRRLPLGRRAQGSAAGARVRVGDALSAMIWAPRSEYTDTSGTNDNANDLSQIRFVTFTATGSSHTLTLSPSADLDVAVYADGAVVTSGGLPPAPPER